MHRRTFNHSLLTSLMLPGLAASQKALAQGAQGIYPERPIRVMQGFAPGGNADTIARVVGTEMAKGLGQPMVVEAQAGAGGTLAAATVSRAKPDGYTLLLATGGHAVAGALYNKLPYQTVASFQMVSTITYFPFMILVPADSKLRDLRDLLTQARGAEALAYGSAGVGSTQHLAGELLGKMAHVKFLHVAYRGDAAALTGLLGGELSFMVTTVSTALGQLKAGKVRALAVTGPKRWSPMPEIPAVAEQGVPGYDVRSWAGWMAPASTPKDVVERLRAETAKALAVPAVRTRLEEMGGEDSASSSPEEMTAMVSSELQKWTRVIADASITKF